MLCVLDWLATIDCVDVFCSYSHRDEPLRQEFESCVAGLRRLNVIRLWHDRQILAGDHWAGEINEHLNRADMIVLFVSADFLNSDYCWNKEMKRALEREAKGEAVVVPIIVRACDWSDAPFAHLQALPSGALALTSWPNRDEAWADVANSLKASIRKLLDQRMKNFG